MIKLQGKYDTRSRYYKVRAQRAALRAVIRPLVRWRSMSAPDGGYTVILGCAHRLSHMLATNLLMLSRQDVTNLHEVLVVVDATRDAMPEGFERDLRRRFDALPLRFLYYTPIQVRAAGLVRWAWVYSWLSWSIGIAATTTRYALLHDFDAMLVRRTLLRERFERIVRQPIDYLGVRNYHCNGVLESDGLVTTFEMMFDCAFVRHHFKPLDLFNHVCYWRGRTVDFDTFLYAQSRLGRTAVMPLEEGEMVHPSQMICQFTELMNGRELNPTRSSLLLIPYFLSVSDDDASLAAITRQLLHNGASDVNFFGRPLDVARLEREHARWLAVQAERLEHAVFGEVREEVRSYFDAVCHHAHRDEHVSAK